MKVDIFKAINDETSLLIIMHNKKISDVVTKDILEQLGEIKLSKTINLTGSTTLVGVSVQDVITSIKNDGYYSTVTATDSNTSSVGAGLGAGILAASLGWNPIGIAIAGIVAAVVVANNTKEKS